MSTKHSVAAGRFLKGDRAVWHDETLWMVRAKRDAMSHSLPEWEQLRDAAAAIKNYSNSHLADLLEEFERNATAAGVHVHWASDAEEFCATVADILEAHGAKHLVKSKSMLAEECGLTPYLEARGIEAAETDLGERILQLMHQLPSHIVLPAIHLRKEEIGDLFRREGMHVDPGNNDQTYLTHAARRDWRHKFLEADAAMTGCNFAVAETGECVVCTNEGNAEMGTSQPKLQITAFGLEKVVPDRRSLGVFTRLLARSATGQPVTTYTAHYRKPRPGGELHFIIVDNGRTDILASPDHVKMLNCLRCGACMNTCPVYRRSGGHSYTYFIPGPVGINLGMLKDPARYSDNVSACSLCHSCQDVCPAKIDLAEQIYKWRQVLDGYGVASAAKKHLSQALEWVIDHPHLFGAAVRNAHLVNSLPHWLMYNRLNEWGKEHDMMHFPHESFSEMWKRGKVMPARTNKENDGEKD